MKPGRVGAAIAVHEAKLDPHPGLTAAIEAAVIQAHLAATPHLTTADAAAAAPVQLVAGRSGVVVLVKADVGLGSVDNTADSEKPVSTAQQTALNGKETAGAAAAAVAAHAALSDPHPVYLTAAEGNAAYEAAGAVATHAAAGDPHPIYLTKAEADALYAVIGLGAWGTITGVLSAQSDLQTTLNAKQATSEKNAASGYAGLDASSKLTGTQQVYGSASNTACQGNDARLSDSRTPLTHATTHKSGGTDAIKLDELAAPTDVTTLNASTAQHGLLPKLGGGTANFLRADGTWAAPTAADYSYSPGSFTVANETAKIVCNHLKMTGSQRMTGVGTGRLRGIG